MLTDRPFVHFVHFSVYCAAGFLIREGRKREDCRVPVTLPRFRGGEPRGNWPLYPPHCRNESTGIAVARMVFQVHPKLVLGKVSAVARSEWLG